MTSILSDLLAEIRAAGNYGTSEARSRVLVSEIENLLGKRTIFYFASEVGIDASSLVSDEDAFVLENLLSTPNDKNGLVLILHSNGGFSISAERIIDVCRSYCKQRGDDSEFTVIVPKRAKSAATILALGAERIFLRDTAELGPVDPQLPVSDNAGNRSYIPAYLQIDAIENLLQPDSPFSLKRLSSLFRENNGKLLSDVSERMKLKFLEQCNYALYVNSKNELGLSDSIIAKIVKEKREINDQILEKDFDIFRDPHLTKSHGRLIGLKDLVGNSLATQRIINSTASLFTNQPQRDTLNRSLWELYVRKKQLLNDAGNNVVKTLEGTDEFFSMSGKKLGQV